MKEGKSDLWIWMVYDLGDGVLVCEYWVGVIRGRDDSKL